MAGITKASCRLNREKRGKKALALRAKEKKEEEDWENETLDSGDNPPQDPKR